MSNSMAVMRDCRQLRSHSTVVHACIRRHASHECHENSTSCLLAHVEAIRYLQALQYNMAFRHDAYCMHVITSIYELACLHMAINMQKRVYMHHHHRHVLA